MKQNIIMIIIGIVLMSLGFIAGTFVGRIDTAETLRLKAKASFYDASVEYSRCKSYVCGDCGERPIWRNGE